MSYTAPALDGVDFELGSYSPPAQDSIDFELSTATADVITAQSATISTDGQDAAISPGPAPISADVGTLLLSAPNAGIPTGDVIEALAAPIDIFGADAGLDVGGSTLAAAPGVVDAVAVDADPIPGPTQIDADTGGITETAQDPSITPGQATIPGQAAIITLQAQTAADIIPAISTVAADAAVLAAVGVDPAIASPFVVPAEPAQINSSAQNVAAVVPGEAPLNASEAQMEFSTFPYPDVSVGTVSIQADAGTLSLLAQPGDVAAVAVIEAQRSSIHLSVFDAGVAAGPASLDAGQIELSLSAQDPTFDSVASILADHADLDLDPRNPAFQAVATIETDAASVITSGQNSTITVGAVSVQADAGTLSLLAQNGRLFVPLDPAVTSLLASDTEPTIIEADQDMAITLTAQQDTEAQISGDRQLTESLDADQDTTATLDAGQIERIELVGSIND